MPRRSSLSLTTVREDFLRSRGLAFVHAPFDRGELALDDAQRRRDVDAAQLASSRARLSRCSSSCRSRRAWLIAACCSAPSRAWPAYLLAVASSTTSASSAARRGLVV
jgi:hypothetical protein